MKKYHINLKIIAPVLVLFSVMISGCKKSDDFFDLRDRGGLDAQIWDNEGAIQFFLNEAYEVIIPDFQFQYTINNFNYHIASDENYLSATDALARRTLGLNGVVASNQIRYVGAKYQGSTMGDNRYFDIARCNLGIKNVPLSTVLSAEAKRKLLGQFYALRAMVYFNLTKMYGGVPLVLEPQNPDNLELGGRAKARVMFAAIVKDLDSAMSNLNGVVWSDATERGKLTKAAAAALKSRALLTWASPQFNPVNDPAHPYEPQRWQTAFDAAEEAYEICMAAGHRLMPVYGEIFQREGSGNTEAIIVRSYSPSVAKRNHGVEARVRPVSENGQPTDAYYATTKLIEAYTMKDGTPITSSTTYDPILFWKDRDPRFEATIAYNGSNWKLSGNSSRRQWTYVNAVGESGNRGFYCKRFASPDLPSGSVRVASDLGGSGMDWIELRFAEVMLDYAETANETGQMALAKNMVRELRQRAGVVVGTKDYGLDYATSQAEMRDLILNERMIEFAFEGKRENDLRRTRRLHLLSGTLESIQVQTTSAANLTQLERIIDPASGRRYRETLDINNKDTVLKYFRNVTVTPSGNGPFNVSTAYYFWDLSSQFLNSSPLLEQTIDWDGGTFDPL